MKILFTILFFISTSTAFAADGWWNEFVWHRYNETTRMWWSNTTIGSGSGTFSKTSMGALTPGDTLFITAGTYTGGTTTNLAGNPGDSVVIIALDWATGGVITVNGSWTFNNCKYVKLVGYTGNTSSSHFQCAAGNISNTRFTSLTMRGTGVGFSTFNSENFTYFDTTTFVTYKIRIDNFDVRGGGQLVRGAFGNLSNGQDYQYWLEIDHGYWENPTNDGDMVTGIIGKILFHDNVINWTASTYTDIHDVGLLTLGGGSCAGRAGAGSGEIYNNAVYGNGFGRGWFLRINVFNFQGHTDSLHLYNNFKWGTKMFGFAQIQITDCDTVSGQIHGANANVEHNTIGNCFSTESAFESVMVYAGTFTVYRMRIKDNIMVNSSLNGAPFIHSVAGWVPSAGDTAKNFYYASATFARMDSVTLAPFARYTPLSSASAIYHTGITTLVTLDAFGVTFATPAPSVGWSEFGTPTPPVGGSTIPVNRGPVQLHLVTMLKPKESKHKKYGV